MQQRRKQGIRGGRRVRRGFCLCIHTSAHHKLTGTPTLTFWVLSVAGRFHPPTLVFPVPGPLLELCPSAEADCCELELRDPEDVKVSALNSEAL